MTQERLFPDSQLISLPRKQAEDWSEIEGYPSYYVSTYGRVYSAWTRWKQNGGSTGGLITGGDQGGGYSQVTLINNDGKVGRTIHSLVMQEHGPPPPSGDHLINHIDGDKSNNHIKNLEWVTEAENRLHAAALAVAKKKSKHEVLTMIERWVKPKSR